MNRIFLALLALFAGIAALAAPASARMAGANDTEIGSVASVRGSTKGATAPSGQVDAPVQQQERRDRDATRVRPMRSRIVIPTVLFGADRALE